MNLKGGLVAKCEMGSGLATDWEGWLHSGVLMYAWGWGGIHQLCNILESTMCRPYTGAAGPWIAPHHQGPIFTEKKGMY